MSQICFHTYSYKHDTLVIPTDIHSTVYYLFKSLLKFYLHLIVEQLEHKAHFVSCPCFQGRG